MSNSFIYLCSFSDFFEAMRNTPMAYFYDLKQTKNALPKQSILSVKVYISSIV